MTFIKKEFVPGKLKPEFALMNKIIHNQIRPKGNEKSPSQEQIQFLYEVMTGKLIDYALVIWCVMRDFLQYSHESWRWQMLLLQIWREILMN